MGFDGFCYCSSAPPAFLTILCFVCSTTGLANLRHLQKLVLTSNHITELRDLTGLPALQHLLLQGNFLCTLQDVGLDMLVSIQFLLAWDQGLLSVLEQ